MKFLLGFSVATLLSLQGAPSYAQANADPGSFLLGASKAQKHAEAKDKARIDDAKTPPSPPAPSAGAQKDDHH